MLSWIFRHRSRLVVIYGRVAPPTLAGERFTREGRLVERFEDVGPKGRIRSGRVAWRAGQLYVGPMPRLL